MIENVTRGLVTSLEQISGLLVQWLGDHMINILVILFGAWIVRHFGTRFISSILSHTVRPDLYPTKSDREKRLKTLSSLVGAFMRTGVYVVAAILIVGEINPQYTTALFASAGLIGVAIGFGAKDAINDFVSGMFIIIENQYRVGDVIEAASISGVVEDITIRSTVLRDLDGNVHHIPNGAIKITTNMTFGFSRLHEDIVVGYDTDIDRLEHIINHVGEVLAADPDLKDSIIEPPKFVRIDSFGDNGIVVKVLGKTVSGEQWVVKGEFYKRLLAALQKNHIEIPYQHVVVHKDDYSKAK